MNWLRAGDDGVLLTLHIQPGAKKTEIVGLHGDALKLRLTAAPIDGKANEALTGFLAKTLGIPKSRVTLVSGQTSRRKCVKVGGLAPADVESRLRI